MTTPRTTFGQIVMACRARPTDEAARAALVDHILERGRDPDRARRIAARVLRDALVTWARELVAGRARLSVRLRAAIRDAARCAAYRPDLVVVPGDQRPRRAGEPGGYTFAGGGACRNPGAARRAGYRVEYVPSTLRVTVGAEWVLNWYRRHAPRRRTPQQQAAHLARFARRATAEPAFLAYYLDRYCNRTGVSEAELAERLGCDRATLTHLALCGAWRPDGGVSFDAYCHAIAERFGVDPSLLEVIAWPW